MGKEEKEEKDEITRDLVNNGGLYDMYLDKETEIGNHIYTRSSRPKANETNDDEGSDFCDRICRISSAGHL